MKVHVCSLLLFLAICYLPGFAKAHFEIVQPFPKNIFPIEGESAAVTCVAFDSQDATVRPQEIKFMRRDVFGMYTELTPDENIGFTSRTENNGRKLFVTMHITNVTSEHDSYFEALGRYECHAFAVGGDPAGHGRKYGFGVAVIAQSEIPHLSVHPSGNHTLQRGDNITLTCSLTGPNYYGTTLKKISWQKNGSKVPNTCSVRYPDQNNPADFLDPLVLNNIDVGVAGTYKCFLEVLLRNIKPYNVSAETTITVQ